MGGVSDSAFVYIFLFNICVWIRMSVHLLTLKTCIESFSQQRSNAKERNKVDLVIFQTGFYFSFPTRMPIKYIEHLASLSTKTRKC